MDTGFLLQYQGGLTPREKTLLSQMFSSPEDLLRLSFREAEEILGRSLGKTRWALKDHLSGAIKAWKLLEGSGIKVLRWEDISYPAQLAEIYDPPFRLYYRGERPLWDSPLLGLVGTRHPTEKGRMLARDLGIECAQAGLWTVSGLARGIDEAVHRGTLEFKGRTLAVLACGLDQVYPKSNTALARQILNQGGCLVSEHPPLTPPLKHHFPLRNRIISGLSRGVVLVQAPVKSGALITTAQALEQGRDVFVCSGAYHPLAGAGGQNLEAEGAVPITSIRQILDNWDRLEAQENTPRYGRRLWTA